MTPVARYEPGHRGAQHHVAGAHSSLWRHNRLAAHEPHSAIVERWLNLLGIRDWGALAAPSLVALTHFAGGSIQGGNRFAPASPVRLELN